MKTIYKYPLKVDGDYQEISMPEGAKILTVALQGNVPTIWAEIEAKVEQETRRFRIYATGEPITEDDSVRRNYIGTFQIVGLVGTLVGHVFEITN